MTRMCRAQFELGDIAEADIICKGRFQPSSSDPETDLDESVTGSNTHNAKGRFNWLNSRLSILPWRLPAWINFSYSRLRVGQQPQRDRHPSPFEPQKEKGSTLAEPCEVRASEQFSPQEGSSNVTKSAPGQAYPPNNPEKKDLRVLNIGLDKLDCNIIVPHPPPAPWDDQAVLDLPYDNPFYTRIIDNVLWLPRNPACVLDLDDTVDMKTSITVEASAGKLGTWLGLGETVSSTPLSQNIPNTPPVEQIARSPAIPGLPEVDGTENIDLPPIIAQRVQAKESGVEQTLRTRKSAVYPRRLSSADKSSITNPASLRIQRPQTPERPTIASYRSFSDSRPRSASVVSAPLASPPDTVERIGSDQELGTRPDAHAQAELVANTSRLSLAPPKLSRTPNVSAAHAIFHEVVQEERQALWNRLEEETAEANQSKNTKSWLTSWMFKKSK